MRTRRQILPEAAGRLDWDAISPAGRHAVDGSRGMFPGRPALDLGRLSEIALPVTGGAGAKQMRDAPQDRFRSIKGHSVISGCKKGHVLNGRGR
jgi:hypothetical protein